MAGDQPAPAAAAGAGAQHPGRGNGDAAASGARPGASGWHVVRPAAGQPRLRAGSAWSLVAVLAAAMAPIVVGIALQSPLPVFVVALSVATVAGALSWWRGARLGRCEAALLALAALVCVPTGPVFALWTALGGAGAVLMLKARGYDVAWWVPRRWWVTTLAVAVVGLGLAGINLAMVRASGVAPEVGGPVLGLLGAVRAGVSEEIGVRSFLLACVVITLGHRPETRAQNVMAYLVLVVPHAAFHAWSFDGLLGQTLVLSVVFGVPLALLMTRFGVLAAVAAHTTIDAVRFLVIGG